MYPPIFFDSLLFQFFFHWEYTTTSTVTVPLVAALGLGLAANVPGRSPLIDGFGLIALASVFPIIAVLGYAQLTARLTRKRKPGDSTERT